MKADGAFHLLCGAGLAQGTYALWAGYGPKSIEPAFVSMAVASAFALGKEGLDSLGLGSPDALDALWTILGGLIGTAVSWAVVRVMR